MTGRSEADRSGGRAVARSDVRVVCPPGSRTVGGLAGRSARRSIGRAVGSRPLARSYVKLRRGVRTHAGLAPCWVARPAHVRARAGVAPAREASWASLHRRALKGPPTPEYARTSKMPLISDAAAKVLPIWPKTCAEPSVRRFRSPSSSDSELSDQGAEQDESPCLWYACVALHGLCGGAAQPGSWRKVESKPSLRSYKARVR